MRRRAGLILLLMGFPLVAPAAEPETKVEEVRILTDRTEATLRPLLEAFEKAKGVKTRAIYVDQGLVNRLEAHPTEADVVITKDAELLELANQKKLLAPFHSEAITRDIPMSFREPRDNYFVDAYRGRVIIYSKARVKLTDLSTYEGLAAPRWKGKLCIRSGFHDYNIGLFSQMAVAFGIDRARAVIQGYHDNLAREPRGSDRDQAKGIFDGKCDIGLMNTYYYPLMQTTPEQKPWADAVGVFYPDQGQSGTFVMRSALGLSRANVHVAKATELLEFFASRAGQELISQMTFQFTTRTDLAMNPVLHSLGQGQSEVKNGQFRINFVPLMLVASKREEIVKILNEVNFDHH